MCRSLRLSAARPPLAIEFIPALSQPGFAGLAVPAGPRDAARMVSLHVRRLARAATLAGVLVAGAASAHDYVVVASNAPEFARGVGVDAGQTLPLSPGRTVTLMHASGDLVTLRGAATPVVVPRRQAAAADSARLDVLRTLVAAREEAREGLGARGRRTRGGICPPPEALTTLDAIAQGVEAGCSGPAGQAMENWLSARIVPEP